MRRRARIRMAGLALVLACWGVGWPAHSTPATEADPLTPEQRALVAWALERFGGAALPLPELRFVFHPSSLDCAGHKGRYHPSTQTIHMCSLDAWTILHELAHAWADASLTNCERAAFAAHRGLTTWGDPDHPWAERAAEHAAEIVAWALAEESHLVPWVEGAPESKRSTFRLLRITDSEPEQLIEAYRFLTRSEPPFRKPTEWQPVDQTSLSPEVARAKSGSPELTE